MTSSRNDVRRDPDQAANPHQPNVPDHIGGPTDLLVAQSICKDYAVRVLDAVDFRLCGGEIHALLGANGAGKSTLCRIISGLIPATSGTMWLDREPFAPRDKRAAESQGVQIVQQELNLFPTLSVAENLLFGRFPNTAGIISHSSLAARARVALDRVGISDVATGTPVSSLGVGQQQMIEIATALDRDCRVLILDEPTAALSGHETATLFDWLGKLRRQGVGIVYISHRLDEVTQIADRVTILRDGKHVATRATNELTSDKMVALMSGDETHVAERDHENFSQPAVQLKVSGLTRLPSVRHVSFQVHVGERLGIAGLVGSGRTELLRAIFGADRATSGTVVVGSDPTPRRFSHPRGAVRAGLALVTEDRKQNGLLLLRPITENTTLGSLGRFGSQLGICNFTRQRNATASIHNDLETHCTSIEQLVGTLSGGNQQKVAVAKWLVRDADVFLFDEPTRGIDVAARRRIYRLFDSLAKQRKSLVIVSSDLDELLETSDRIIVMSAGQLSGEFHRDNWDREAILQACFAGYRETTQQASA